MVIGVCYPDKYPVEETFQLLKIPWEWYEPGKPYDVVIARKAEITGYDGPLIDLTDNDFFRTICALLNKGQPHLHEPLCDIALDRIRQELKKYTILVEIPPCPWGHPYMVALTHDVDVTSVRECRWSTVGYAAYQCLLQGRFLSGIQFLTARLGLGKDPWDLFERWKGFEQDLGVRSTFFFVPMPGKPGRAAHPYRAVSYVPDTKFIQSLTESGWEEGVHGIDNWTDADEGRKEKDSLGLSNAGNRTHWLLFDECSWVALENAGYSYDTTFGYNDDVGFRAGTLQVFRPESVENLLELPLHIQDLGLFGTFCWAPKGDGWEKTPCMHLSEQDARECCHRILDYALQYGGGVTLLWHYENLVPPREWSRIYRVLVSRAKSDGAWVTTAGNVVEWFRVRRSTKIGLLYDKKKIIIKFQNYLSDQKTPLRVRLHIDYETIEHIDGDYLHNDHYVDIRCDRPELTVILR